jgi:hypothetical protein
LARLENLHCQELDAKDDTSLLDKLASNIAKSLELGLAENRIDSSTAEAASACLYQLSTAWSYRLDDNVLLLTTAYTDSNDPWTTEAGAYSSSTMLEQHLLGDRLTEFIVKTVLQGYLRPLFSKSTTKVTDSGRPNQFPDSASQRIGLEQAPWKAQQPRVISTFRWAVHSSNVSRIYFGSQSTSDDQP